MCGRIISYQVGFPDAFGIPHNPILLMVTVLVEIIQKNTTGLLLGSLDETGANVSVLAVHVLTG